jgi:16S rRNA (uracil1498-N3)-methyltransferase
MTHRYYLETDTPLAQDSEATLTGAEAHHFLHVMRGKRGDSITLFDGLGNEAEATVTVRNRREIEVQVGATLHDPKLLPLQLDLGISLPKGDRARWLIEKLTELGVTSLTPLITERSIAQPSGKPLEKLRRYSIEACKQSGRNQLLEVYEASRIEAFDQRFASNDSESETRKIMAHPYGATVSPKDLVLDAVAAKRPISLVIGPEGGLADEELEVLHALGWQSVSLGSRILRIETAALALASLVAICAEHECV